MAAEAFDIYPSEYPKIEAVGKRINARFANKALNTQEHLDQFTDMTVTEYAKIGYKVAVQWMEARDIDTYEVINWTPQIQFLGRINPEEEIDHDRMAHDIVTGKADGQRGFIRADGTKHEEPIRKLIT